MKQENLSDFINSLNPEQRSAVTFDGGSVLVLAAAGSGKTTTLTCRIAYLVAQKNVPITNILAVTFTNKASKEMKNRLLKMAIGSGDMWVGTFHSICSKVLREHYEKVGLKKNFYIMDQSEQLTFIKRLLKSIGVSDDVEPNIIQDEINSFKESGKRSKDLGQNIKNVRIYEAYEKACLLDNCVDFAELMLGCYDVLRNYPEVCDFYASRFEYVLVDEFQDTNELQYKWLKLMSGTHKRVFAVGDDDQSIYGFRGAKPQNMELFKKDFGAKVIKIEQNYRSDAFILKAANAVISQNKNRQGKNLVPTIEAKKKILIYEAINDIYEASFIADEIKRARRTGVHYKSMAILYRTNAQSRSIEKSLTAAAIPYVIYGGFRFFDRQEIKNVMAYLRLANNPDDNMAFLRVANTPARAVGATTLLKLDALSKESGVSLFSQAKMCDDKKLKSKFDPFIDKIDLLVKMCKGKSLPQMVENVIEFSGLEKMYQDDKVDGANRLDNIYELISAAKVFLDENPKSAIDEFLTFASLEPEASNKGKNKDEDAVQVMTIHASKGLEFESVFICGLEESLLPHANSLLNNEAIEEERRLMYVALTRAKTSLYLTRAAERMLHGKSTRLMGSRFLKELPKDSIEFY